MSTLLRTLVVGSGLLLSQATASAATLENVNIGNWLAGAYSNEQTGDFNHCAASSNYRNGISLMFAISKRYTWSVGFANPKWQLDKGSRYAISLRVDGPRTLDATAVAISNTFVEASLADSASLFNAFKYGNMLSVYAADQTFKFQLTDTSQLLPFLLDCVKRYNDRAPRTSANPFAPQIPAQTPAIATPTPDMPKVSPADINAFERRAEATSLIANILAKSGVSGFEILGPGQTEKFKGDAAWRAGTSFGTMQILADDSATPEDLNAQILASDSKACHDKFYSGSMPDASGSRMFTSCRSDTQTMTVFYSTIKRPKGGYYVLATGGVEHIAQGDGKPTRELDNGIRSAAYHMVTP